MPTETPSVTPRPNISPFEDVLLVLALGRQGRRRSRPVRHGGVSWISPCGERLQRGVYGCFREYTRFRSGVSAGTPWVSHRYEWGVTPRIATRKRVVDGDGDSGNQCPKALNPGDSASLRTNGCPLLCRDCDIGGYSCLPEVRKLSNSAAFALSMIAPSLRICLPVRCIAGR